MSSTKQLDEQDKQPLVLKTQNVTGALVSVSKKGIDGKRLFSILSLSALCLLIVSGGGIWWYLEKATPNVTLYRVTTQEVKLYTSGAGIVYPSINTIDKSIIDVHVELPLTYLSQVTLSQTALVHPSTIPNLTVEGKVTNIVQQTDPMTDDTFEFWVSVDDKDHRLLTGTSASVLLQRTVRGAMIPRLAILDMHQDPQVFVFRNQRAYLQRVHIGGFSKDSVVISAGLSNGDTVVLVGKDQVENGQIVRVRTVENLEEKSKNG